MKNTITPDAFRFCQYVFMSYNQSQEGSSNNSNDDRVFKLNYEYNIFDPELFKVILKFIGQSFSVLDRVKNARTQS